MADEVKQEQQDQNQQQASIDLAFNIDMTFNFKDNVVSAATIEAAEDNAIKIYLKSVSASGGSDYHEMYVTPYYMDGSKQVTEIADVIAYVNKSLSLKELGKNLTGQLKILMSPLKTMPMSGTRSSDKQITAKYNAPSAIVTYMADYNRAKYVKVLLDGNAVETAIKNKILQKLTPFFDVEIFHK